MGVGLRYITFMRWNRPFDIYYFFFSNHSPKIIYYNFTIVPHIIRADNVRVRIFHVLFTPLSDERGGQRSKNTCVSVGVYSTGYRIDEIQLPYFIRHCMDRMNIFYYCAFTDFIFTKKNCTEDEQLSVEKKTKTCVDFIPFPSTRG